MASTHLPSSTSYDLRMSLAFMDFCERTTEYNDLTKWFQDNVAHHKNIKTMLCVGSGQGFDLTLARHIKTLTHLTMIDKSEIQLQMAMQKSPTDSFTVDVMHISFEEFVPLIKYDLVLFSHVLYYIPDRIDILKKAIAMLSDHGFILIFHQTEQGINELQKLFKSMTFSYSLSDLKQDLEAAKFVHTTCIIESTVRIDMPTKELCDFILEKNCCEHEQARLSAHLCSLGDTLYHPSGIVIIHRFLNESHVALLNA